MGRTTRSVSIGRPSSARTASGRAAAARRRGTVKRGYRDRRRAGNGRRRAAAAAARKAEVATAVALDPTLSEEERIESAKYLPRHVPPRVFEEERFLFPESYGVDRVRLLVKDPEWLFAYWDLSPRSVDGLRKELGERGMALTRLTLRITDPGHGGTSVVLLPYGARAWYVRADTAARSYRAQLGWTLPSGQFRLVAESNMVSTPRVGPSPELAARRLRYDAALAAIEAALRSALREPEPGPWRTETSDAEKAARSRRQRRTGGASDVFRPGGASDVFRR